MLVSGKGCVDVIRVDYGQRAQRAALSSTEVAVILRDLL